VTTDQQPATRPRGKKPGDFVADLLRDAEQVG
jgi:hypothetical protein